MPARNARVPRRARRAVAGLAVLLPVAGVLPAQSVAWTSSIYGATGDYIFTERSTNVALTNGLTLTAGRVRLSGSLPIVFQSTPWIAMSGAGPVPTGGSMHGTVGDESGQYGHRRGLRVSLPASGVTDEIGLGDPMFFGGVDLVRERGGLPTVSVTGGIKVPISSADDGFGTGELDYGAGVALSRAFDRTMLFLDGAYWVIGDMPDLPLRDVFTVGAAVGRILGDGDWSALLSASGSQATIDGSDPPVQAGVMVSRRWLSGRSLSGSISIGLTSSAPDVAASLGWRVPLS